MSTVPWSAAPAYRQDFVPIIEAAASAGRG
jgi:hypothetical protein